MSVPRYTTPTFRLTFDKEGLNLTDVDNVYVTFESNGSSITKTGEDLNVGEKTIEVTLSQEETAQFAVGYVQIQANWYKAGLRVGSSIVYSNISENLLGEVIPGDSSSNESGGSTS